MKKTFQFPAVTTRAVAGGYEATTGFDLKSILKADLFFDNMNFTDAGKEPGSTRGDKALHLARETFVRALDTSGQDACFEMRFTACPDLVVASSGKIFISLVIRTFSSNEEEARAQALAAYMGLRPLLLAYMKEAEFAPIPTAELLEKRVDPFPVKKAVSIGRPRETISLTAPSQRSEPGFGAKCLGWDGKPGTVSHLFPWVPSYGTWHGLLDTLLGQVEPCHIIIRLRPSRESRRFWAALEATACTCELFMAGKETERVSFARRSNAVREAALAHASELRHNAFRVGAFILAPHSLDMSVANVLGTSITAMSGSREGSGIYCGGFSVEEVDVSEALDPMFFPEQEPFTASEAACAFRLPSPPMDESTGLPVRRARTSAALLPHLHRQGQEPIELVVNEHQGSEQPVIVNRDDRMLHTFIIGATGSGKSTLMEAMALQDIRSGHGVAVIDPHGELVEAIIGKMPQERWQDVILFDMLERKRPVGFNILEYRDVEERDLIIDELYLTLDRIWDMRQVGGPIWESNFRGMLKCLMGERNHREFVPTLLEFSSCYLEEGFRKWLRKHITDPQTLDFLEELERTRGDAALSNLSPYVTSKFSRFIHDTILKRILGQERTAFDFDEIMNRGKIFLVNLGKGRFGPTASALLANQLVSRFKLAAMKRGGMRASERRAFYLYLDEAHNLPSENLCELLSEARKYRLGLILATQFTGQISRPGSREGDLLSAILGNVGTILIFRLGQEDAIKLAPTVYPSFSTADIVGLSNWHGYCRVQVKGTAPLPFSFKTYKDTTPYDEETAFRVRALSNLKYGTDAKEVDARILKRRSIWKSR